MASNRRIGLNNRCGEVMGNPFVRETIGGEGRNEVRRVKVATGDHPVQMSRNHGRFQGDFTPCVCRNPRSAAGDVLEADAYLQCSLRNGFSMLRIAFAFSATLAMFACFSSHAHAAQCGSSSAGYSAWKQEFSGEARAK